ncbi:ROK family protein [Chelativorans sp. YIM 93263]|uniref:ROK family protein n=1 Tax=Chelativorans sp. YIM 93263 TaxID=2906648 RepID=UPI00237910F7|nr:ROK family protein [Chelativorans sp. YIM 93263]
MVISFDIGGTTIRSAVARSTESIEPIRRQPTPTEDFDAFLACLRQAIADAGEAPAYIAISIAGVLDPESGRAICANISCIHGRRLKTELEQALGVHVIIANDADCFAVAEARVGAGKGHEIVFGAILGTGVGGGLVARGQLVNANGGFAGEWGHAPVAAAYAGTPPVRVPAFQCGCGMKGCLDPIGSARGMERLHKALHDQDRSSMEIIAAWEEGDPSSARTIDVLCDVLSAPLAMVVNVTGATIVPVGGGLSNAGSLIAELDRRVRKQTLFAFKRPLVMPGACRDEPGLLGAALLGLERAARGASV